MSLSQMQYQHAAGDCQEQFEPTYVKLDKQVSIILSIAVSDPEAWTSLPRAGITGGRRLTHDSYRLS